MFEFLELDFNGSKSGPTSRFDEKVSAAYVIGASGDHLVGGSADFADR